jgi:hypothetical protein
MSYAFIQDVPAGWDSYERVAAAIGDEPPDGLIVHVAGPTDSGFRVIEVWESKDAWERFRDERLRPVVKTVAGDGPAHQPIFQPLDVRHMLMS